MATLPKKKTEKFKVTCGFCGNEIINPIVQRIPCCPNCKKARDQYWKLEKVEYHKKYKQTPRGKKVIREYQKGEKFKEAQRGYRNKMRLKKMKEYWDRLGTKGRYNEFDFNPNQPRKNIRRYFKKIVFELPDNTEKYFRLSLQDYDKWRKVPKKAEGKGK